MSAVSICPQPGCRSENTGPLCHRCGADVTQILCPNCASAHPAGALVQGSLACQGCQANMAALHVLVVPPGRSDLAIDEVVADRFRIRATLGNDLYLAIDTRPNLKRMLAPIASGSPAESYKRFSHLPGLPAVLEVVPDEASRDLVLLSGPYDRNGDPYPRLADRWASVSSQRRLTWLAAWTRVAMALAADGWSRSALEADNLRVAPDGSLQVRALLPDEASGRPAEQLADLWLELLGAGREGGAVPALALRLKAGDLGLVDAERELLALRARPRVEVRHGGRTDTGRRRENNEDSFLAWQGSFHEVRPEGPVAAVRGLFAVCDGMGGHERGEVASRTCIGMLHQLVPPVLLAEDPGDGDLAGRLRHLVRHDVNSAILARNGGEQGEGPFRRMGTTVVMVAVVDDRVCWVHVGDSRIYRIMRGQIEQITEDHNVGTRDVKMGVATMLEAFRSPVGKHLTQALGPRGGEFVHPDSGFIDLDEPCVLLLCSDGLADMVPESDVLKTVTDHWDDPAAAVADLIEQANLGGGLDNITALAIRIEPGEPAFGRRPATAAVSS